MNRKFQSGSADVTGIAQLGKEKQALEDKLQEHEDIALESLQYYMEMKMKCCEQWNKITTLESKHDRLKMNAILGQPQLSSCPGIEYLSVC